MKRRLLSVFIGVAALLTAMTAFAYAAETAATNRTENYDTLQSAVDAYSTGVIQLRADAANLTVTKDTCLDLNGYDISGVTVTGGTLYICDSQTDDYTVADGIYGTVTGITGQVKAAGGYLPVTEGEYLSFHRTDLRIRSMSLRPSVVGVYYGSSFAGDELVANKVQSFGIALSVAAEPGEGNMDTLCEYSVFTEFSPGIQSATGTLLTGIMKQDSTQQENAQNAAMPVYGRPYILTDEGYTFGNCVVGNLQSQLEAIDSIWDELTATQKDALLAMYQKYQAVMDHWAMPNIQSIMLTEKFVTKFQGDFLYRVGNQNDLTVGSLFAAAEGAKMDAVTVSVSTVSGSAAGTYTAAEPWTAGKLKFSGLGIVNVTIRAAGAVPVTLQLEVVEAVNSTTAASATANNVVLLNNTGFGSIVVKNGYTLYGNGFTMTCGSDSPALDMGYAFVTLENGNLDNVKIICPNFWHASLYKANLTSEENETQVEGSKTRYYNARSAVMASGNNTISNAYISGGRAAIYLTGGTTKLDNTTIYGGAAANIHVLAGASGLVMRDVKLIQEPIRATNRDKTIMGMSVVLMSGDGAMAVPPITLEGDLIQYAWINRDYAQYIPEDTSTIIEEVFTQTEFIHTIDGEPSVNLGFVVCPSDDKSTGALTVSDNRTNQNTAPYDQTVLDIAFVGDVVIYSCTNEKGTDPAFLTKPEHIPGYNPAPLQMVYADNTADCTLSKVYDPVTNAWEYKLVANLDAGSCSLDFAKLQVLEQGTPVAFTVTDAEGNAVDPDARIPLSVGNVSYTVTAMGTEIRFVTVGTKKEILPPKLISANYESGICVATTSGGTWSGAAPALEGIQVQYYSVAEGGYKTIDLSTCTPTTPGKQNGTDNTWFYEAQNGDFTLTLTGGQVHSSNNIFAMPVVCNGKLYFVASSSKGLVNSGNTARAVKVSYVFRDNATDAALTFEHTWSVEENKDAQYSYSNFCSGTLTKLENSSSDNCVVQGTMITLADGSRVPVEDLTGEEMLLVWNLETGRYEAAPIVFVDKDAETAYEVITLQFSDGTEVEVIYEHGFFDVTTGEYVYLDAANAAEHIGHSFVKQGEIAQNTWQTVTLENVVIETKVTTAYSPVTFSHLCYYVDGMLSMPGGIEGLFNIFQVNVDTMTYDAEKMAADIETYGLFTYEDFAGMIPEEAFYAFNGAWLKVAMGKGMLTWEDIAYMADRYVPLM